MVQRLARALMKLAGETVNVELKNGSVVSGQVVGVDIAMNTHMKYVKVTQKNGKVSNMNHLSLRGGTIRYVILPDTFNLDILLQDTTPRPKMGDRGGRGGRNTRGRRGGRRGGGGRGSGGRGGAKRGRY